MGLQKPNQNCFSHALEANSRTCSNSFRAHLNNVCILSKPFNGLKREFLLPLGGGKKARDENVAQVYAVQVSTLACDSSVDANVQLL